MASNPMEGVLRALDTLERQQDRNLTRELAILSNDQSAKESEKARQHQITMFEKQKKFQITSANNSMIAQYGENNLTMDDKSGLYKVKADFNPTEMPTFKVQDSIEKNKIRTELVSKNPWLRGENNTETDSNIDTYYKYYGMGESGTMPDGSELNIALGYFSPEATKLAGGDATPGVLTDSDIDTYQSFVNGEMTIDEETGERTISEIGLQEIKRFGFYEPGESDADVLKYFTTRLSSYRKGLHDHGRLQTTKQYNDQKDAEWQRSIEYMNTWLQTPMVADISNKYSERLTAIQGLVNLDAENGEWIVASGPQGQPVSMESLKKFAVNYEGGNHYLFIYDMLTKNDHYGAIEYFDRLGEEVQSQLEQIDPAFVNTLRGAATVTSKAEVVKNLVNKFVKDPSESRDAGSNNIKFQQLLKETNFPQKYTRIKDIQEDLIRRRSTGQGLNKDEITSLLNEKKKLEDDMIGLMKLFNETGFKSEILNWSQALDALGTIN